MRLAQINLPVSDNDGNRLSEVHDSLKSRLCTAFGGFTSWFAQGGWEPVLGRVVTEDIIVYQVAYDPNVEDDRLAFFTIAEVLKALANQEAIFLVIDGEAYIV